MNHFIVAVVPAKMTSRRLPRKNIVDLCGKPLIYYSIRVGQLVKQIDSVYVSSEDDGILSLSIGYGANSILRPGELSKPDITNKYVMSHAAETIRSGAGKYPELVVLLQPTHPLRKPADIEQGITMMLDNPLADSLFTIVRSDDLRGQIIDGRFVPEFQLPRNRLKEPVMYRNCGSFYIFRPERTFLSDSFFGRNILPLVLSRPEFEVNIDSYSDLIQARCLLESNKEEFGHFDISD